MPRNPDTGDMQAPAVYPPAPGSPISLDDYKAVVGDIHTEITDSLSRSGHGAMTAPMRATNGSAAAPSVTFDSNQNSGIYTTGTNVAVSVGGAKKQEWTDSGTAITGNASVSGETTVAGLTKMNGGGQVTGDLAVTGEVAATTVQAGNTTLKGGGAVTLELPAALPTTTLPVTVSAAGVVSTGKITNAQQNFGAPVNDTDVVIKSYIGFNAPVLPIFAGSFASNPLSTIASFGTALGLATVSKPGVGRVRLVFPNPTVLSDILLCTSVGATGTVSVSRPDLNTVDLYIRANDGAGTPVEGSCSLLIMRGP